MIGQTEITTLYIYRYRLNWPKSRNIELMNNFKDMLRGDSVLLGDGRSHAGGQDIQVLNDDLSFIGNRGISPR